MKKGLLISFEGIDGSGKSTQVELLYNYLKDLSYKVAKSREPGGILDTEKIRDILLKSKYLPDKAETLLLLSSRSILVNKFIKYYLSKDYIVILDRYIDSTIAYQGYGRGLDIEFLNRLNSWVIEKIYPDITFLLDIPVKLSLKRRDNNLDRIEKEKISFFENVRKGYLDLAEKEKRILLIDAKSSIEEIFTYIKSIVDKKLKERL